MTRIFTGPNAEANKADYIAALEADPYQGVSESVKKDFGLVKYWENKVAKRKAEVQVLLQEFEKNLNPTASDLQEIAVKATSWQTVAITYASRLELAQRKTKADTSFVDSYTAKWNEVKAFPIDADNVLLTVEKVNNAWATLFHIRATYERELEAIKSVGTTHKVDLLINKVPLPC